MADVWHGKIILPDGNEIDGMVYLSVFINYTNDLSRLSRVE